MRQLAVKPLTSKAFAPFGDVIEMSGNDPVPMNRGMASRYHGLAGVDVRGEGGRAVISLVHSTRYPLPHVVKLVERHPLGSQSFTPLAAKPFIVVVAAGDDDFDPSRLLAFKTNGSQGINYHCGVWHGPLCTPFEAMDFICVDREGEGDNCEEQLLDEKDWVELII